MKRGALTPSLPISEAFVLISNESNGLVLVNDSEALSRNPMSPM